MIRYHISTEKTMKREKPYECFQLSQAILTCYQHFYGYSPPTNSVGQDFDKRALQNPQSSIWKKAVVTNLTQIKGLEGHSALLYIASIHWENQRGSRKNFCWTSNFLPTMNVAENNYSKLQHSTQLNRVPQDLNEPQ